jgi:hypothetical protein
MELHFINWGHRNNSSDYSVDGRWGGGCQNEILVNKSKMTLKQKGNFRQNEIRGNCENFFDLYKLHLN